MFDIKNDVCFESELQYEIEDADKEVEFKFTINTGRARAVAQAKYARQDAAHVHAPGLFRAIEKGARSVEKLDVKYERAGLSVRFVGHEPLGADDMTVLLGLNALAEMSRGVLGEFPATERGQELRRRLELQFHAKGAETLVVDSSYQELAREIGHSNTRNTKQIRNSLDRLFAVTVIVEGNGKREGFRLLSNYLSDDKSGGLYVALNPRIARAILGEGGSQYIKFSMQEVASLNSNIAKLLHYRICGAMNTGSKQPFLLETLRQYAWPIESEIANTVKSRNKAVRAALSEIQEKLGWQIEKMNRATFMITRPRFK